MQDSCGRLSLWRQTFFFCVVVSGSKLSIRVHIVSDEYRSVFFKFFYFNSICEVWDNGHLGVLKTHRTRRHDSKCQALFDHIFPVDRPPGLHNRLTRASAKKWHCSTNNAYMSRRLLWRWGAERAKFVTRRTGRAEDSRARARTTERSRARHAAPLRVSVISRHIIVNGIAPLFVELGPKT